MFLFSVAKSCPTLCDPMDYTVHGILQATILEWAAYSSRLGSLLQGIFPTQGLNLGLPQADSLPAEPPGKSKNTGVGSLSFLQQIFLTQESNWGSLHYRQILYYCAICCCFSVTESWLTLQTHEWQHARLPCSSLSPRVCSNSCPLSWWCYLTFSSSVIPFSFCLQHFLASGSFPVSWLFASGGQSIGASASASVLPVYIQGWFPLGLTGLISLQSKGLSRVFSSSTILKHQFFGA